MRYKRNKLLTNEFHFAEIDVTRQRFLDHMSQLSVMHLFVSFLWIVVQFVLFFAGTNSFLHAEVITQDVTSRYSSTDSDTTLNATADQNLQHELREIRKSLRIIQQQVQALRQTQAQSQEVNVAEQIIEDLYAASIKEVANENNVATSPLKPLASLQENVLPSQNSENNADDLEFKKQYTSALALLKTGSFTQSYDILTALMQKFPHASRMDYVLYWQGMAALMGQQFTQAQKIFSQGYRRFPESEKKHDFLIRLASSLQQDRQTQKACAILAFVLKQNNVPIHIQHEAQSMHTQMMCTITSHNHEDNASHD